MPIITSRLDTDFYKYLMNQAIWLKHRDNPTLYAFKCRNPYIALPKLVYIGDLRKELDHVHSLQHTDEEIDYLRQIAIKGKRIFQEEYLRWLRSSRLPEYHIRGLENEYQIEFEGPWANTMFWETFCLSIVNELLYAKLTSRELINHIRVGELLLKDKIKTLKRYPGIRIADFGTRRRFSKDWQEAVLEELITNLKDGQLIGTSNVAFAKQFGITPTGTVMSHELDMGVEGILRAEYIDHSTLRDVHPYVMDWLEEIYPYDLLINLPDTYGSDFALSQMTAERMRNWKGERQDSGKAIPFGEKRIRRYNQFGIDPRKKVLVFSDGLKIKPITSLYEYFVNKIQVSFGWGTGLMNHLILKPTPIVVKLVRSNSFWTVKLSDNPWKHTGREEDIEAAKASLDYVDGIYEAGES